jgi:hypothetical protein
MTAEAIRKNRFFISLPLSCGATDLKNDRAFGSGSTSSKFALACLQVPGERPLKDTQALNAFADLLQPSLK